MLGALVPNDIRKPASIALPCTGRMRVPWCIGLTGDSVVVGIMPGIVAGGSAPGRGQPPKSSGSTVRARQVMAKRNGHGPGALEKVIDKQGQDAGNRSGKQDARCAEEARTKGVGLLIGSVRDAQTVARCPANPWASSPVKLDNLFVPFGHCNGPEATCAWNAVR